MGQKFQLLARLYDDYRQATISCDILRQHITESKGTIARLEGIIEADRNFIDELSNHLISLRSAELSPALEGRQVREATLNTVLDMIHEYETERREP